MNNVLKKLCKDFLTILQFAYRNARGSDHRLLAHYILKINQLQDVDSIIYHASRCLFQMLDYQLFAFAMYDREYNGGVDIWMDPKIDNQAVMNFIKKDFNSRDLYCNVRYFSTSPSVSVSHVDITHIITISVIDAETRAMLYILPRRTVLEYHRELLDIIVKTIATAIGNFINLKKLENAALIDPLTHCYNRRALDGSLDRDLASAERYGTDLSVIMFDIDYFKNVNDRFGHTAGDAVLRAVSKSVLAAIRKSDYLSRYGGEEFILVLPETKFSKTIELAERLRIIVENLKMNFDDKTISVTASFGVTVYKKGMGKQALLQRADEMLYEAKRQGRNRIKPDLKVFQRQGYSELLKEKPVLH
ncbi:MAG: GGDEF domain-containing protein [Pseudomonadota bacterium]